MLFQLSHANEKDDGVGYTIKHVFIQASSLIDAHIFVTRFGYRITPEYYDDADELYEPDSQQVENIPCNYSLEQFERMNEECSQGEHFWHALKLAANNGISIQLGGETVFKVTIQFNVPCLQHYENEPANFSMYKIEMNSDIYQFQAHNSIDILQYIRQNSNRFHLVNFFQEFPIDFDWQAIEQILEERCKCINTNHLHGSFIRINCEQLQAPLAVIDSQM